MADRSFQSVAEARMAGMNPVQRFGQQTMYGAEVAAPSFYSTPFPAPEPRTTADRIAQGVGQFGMYGLEGAALAGPLGAVGAPVTLAGAVAGGVPLALSAGTPQQRLARGVAGAAGGAAMGPVGSKVGRFVGGVVEGAGGGTAAQAVGRAAGEAAGGSAVIAGPQAVGQQALESKLTGQPYRAPTLTEMARNFAVNMGAALAMHGAGAGVRAVAGGPKTPVQLEGHVPPTETTAADAVPREGATAAEQTPKPAPQPGPATAATPKPAPEAKLPASLAGAKPRYSYGSKQFEVQFQSDIDKAAYITAQKNPSKADTQYRDFLRSQGMSDADISAHGANVRSQIKGMAANADPEAGPLRVPTMNAPRSAAQPEPAAPEQPSSALASRYDEHTGRLAVHPSATPDDINAAIANVNDRLSQPRSRAATEKLLAFRDRLQQRIGSGQPDIMDKQAPEKVMALRQKIQSLGPMTEEQKAARTVERGKRIAQVKEVLKRTSGEAGYTAALRKLQGRLPSADFAPMNVPQADKDWYYSAVQKSPKLDEYDRITAQRGLKKMFGAMGTQMPNDSELEKLGRVFGDDFVNDVMTKRPTPERMGRVLTEAMNAPRVFQLMLHMTGPFIQGGKLVWSYPREWGQAVGHSLQSFGSESRYRGLNEKIEQSPDFSLAYRSGLRLSKAGPLPGQREDLGKGGVFEKLPGVGPVIRAGNRGFAMFGRSFRYGVFEQIVDGLRAGGVDPLSPSRAEMAQQKGRGGTTRMFSAGARKATIAEDAARFVNNFTSAGEVPPTLGGGEALFHALYAPGIVAGDLRMLTPHMYVQLDPAIRQTALMSLLRFTGGVTAALTLAAMNGAEVSLDPKDPNFGMARFGDTRIDPTSGVRQYVRMGLLLGEWLTQNHDLRQRGRRGTQPTYGDQLLRFARGKLAPLPSVGADVLSGQMYLKDEQGRPVKPTAAKEAEHLFGPLVSKDIIDLYKKYGPKGLAVAPLPAFGVPTHTYPNRGRAPSLTLNRVLGLQQDTTEAAH
jgi:hypothetical protein